MFYILIFLRQEIMPMVSNKPLKIRVSITLDRDVVEKIHDLRNNDFRSFSQYINIVLRRHIERMEEKQK